MIYIELILTCFYKNKANNILADWQATSCQGVVFAEAPTSGLPTLLQREARVVIRHGALPTPWGESQREKVTTGLNWCPLGLDLGRQAIFRLGRAALLSWGRFQKEVIDLHQVLSHAWIEKSPIDAFDNFRHIMKNLQEVAGCTVRKYTSDDPYGGPAKSSA